ncbi:hypothetical protein C8R44DRAFT_952176 [Mycena epipterygia]|nr:hypothetical protein C8R44DRAFT_952176 [Mycena epipterygia]
MNSGHFLLLLIAGFFFLASYAILLSPFVPLTDIYANFQILDVLANDTHYKYFGILLILTTAYFVIANWVG